jgi:hypothetical protein
MGGSISTAKGDSQSRCWLWIFLSPVKKDFEGRALNQREQCAVFDASHCMDTTVNLMQRKEPNQLLEYVFIELGFQSRA